MSAQQTRHADICVVGLGPTGRAVAHRAMRAGFDVVAVDPRPDRLWSPTFSCWIDELPDWLPKSTIASRIPAPTVWTRTEHRIERPYCVLSKPLLFEALPLDDATVIAGRAASMDKHRVELRDGTVISATLVVDSRGMPTAGKRRTASAHGIFVDADRAAPMVSEGEGLLLDWRDENGAGPDEPPSFLYSVPIGDGTVIFEETSLGLRGGMPQHELRRRAINRLTAHGITLRGDEPAEAAHYPLDIPPPPIRASARATDPVPFGSRGGMMHPTTGYSVADSFALVDTLVDTLRTGNDPVHALWPWQARLVYWMRMRGIYGLGRITTDQSISMFESFFTATPEQQRALLSDHANYRPLATALVDTVHHTQPFRWRFDLVGLAHRNRWVGYQFPAAGSDPVIDRLLAEDDSLTG